MEKYEEDMALKATKFMEDLSLYEPCPEGPYGRGGRRDLALHPDLEETKRVIAAHMTAEQRGRKMNGPAAPPPPAEGFPAAGRGSAGPAVVSPRSSISSQSSRSSRGSMSAYPELQLPSPRSSLLGPGLQEDGAVPELGDAFHRIHAQSPPRHDQQHPAGAPEPPPPYAYSPTKGSASAPKFKLPYQVTPCRESGPSQAERRLEALTLELEKELEMHMKKEYFGEWGGGSGRLEGGGVRGRPSRAVEKAGVRCPGLLWTRCLLKSHMATDTVWCPKCSHRSSLPVCEPSPVSS
ncbi:Wilms tumor protein 1-interacting protein-like [Parus major]|uniref:Wilms tumor protein 1-interacting protein-like n=1 Tax=Parus major TaxID=9157 RepID=UPI001444660E|nr:Wilms tumor protein 1-interacting protein-like [Parus major]